MKVKIVRMEEASELQLPWGRGFTHNWKGDEAITIQTKAFETTIHPAGVKISYTIFRNHDHNNSPEIFFELPEEGHVKEHENSAKLTVQSSSGHLNLDMFYNDYVWERGLELVVKKYEYEKLRSIYENKGLEALLNHLDILVEGKKS